MRNKVDNLIDKWGEWYRDERNCLAFDTVVLSAFWTMVFVVTWTLCKRYL